INGTNIYPQDVESSAAEAHPSIRPGGVAAFQHQHDDRERLVVVGEVRASHGAREALEQAIAQMQSRILAEHGVSPFEIVLIEPGSLPRTTSGKVQRRRCSEQYAGRRLQVIASSTS